MNTKNNQRAQKTRETIKLTFMNLLTKKPLGEITVGEICNHAHINRSTFYTHFIDILDLMEKIELNISEKMFEVFATGQVSSMREAFIHLFTFIQENAAFYKSYFDNSNQPKILNIVLPDTYVQTVIRLIDELGYASEVEYRYHDQFFRAGLTGLIRLWLKRECAESPEEMSQIIINEYNQNRRMFDWANANP